MKLADILPQGNIWLSFHPVYYFSLILSNSSDEEKADSPLASDSFYHTLQEFLEFFAKIVSLYIVGLEK